MGSDFFENSEATPNENIGEVLPLLKRCVDILTIELGEPSQHPKLFRNIIGGKLEAKAKIEAARNAADYLLLDQIIFYRVLSALKGIREIDPDSLSTPQELNEYFSKVLEENFSGAILPETKQASVMRAFPFPL